MGSLRNSRWIGWSLTKLVQEAQKSWRRIRAVKRIAELLAGTVFNDSAGIRR
jgi:hypothetical protein